MTTLVAVIIIDVISILSMDVDRTGLKFTPLLLLLKDAKPHLNHWDVLVQTSEELYSTSPTSGKNIKHCEPLSVMYFTLKNKVYFVTFILYIIYSLLQMISAVGEQFLFNC